jgi:hypothetical protein
MGKYENPWNPSVKQIPILINYKKIDQRKRPCKFITCVLFCTIACSNTKNDKLKCRNC